MFVQGEDRALDITSLETLRPNLKQVVNAGSVGQQPSSTMAEGEAIRAAAPSQ